MVCLENDTNRLPITEIEVGVLIEITLHVLSKKESEFF